MNARQIEVFRTIMRCGTLTAAAQALNVSQPALSQLLLHAEDQLGFRLFQRLHGRLTPTPEAHQLFPEAERLYRDLEGFRRFAVDLRHGKQVYCGWRPRPPRRCPSCRRRWRTSVPPARACG